MIKGRLWVVVVSCLLVGACTWGGPGTGAVSYPTGPGQLVLRVALTGVSPEFVATSIPSFSLYGDGSLITEGAVPMIFPGPAYPPLIVTRVSPAGVRRIVDAAIAAGLLGPDRAYTAGAIVGAPTTVFTLVANGRRHTISVYALGSTGGVGMSANERRARAALQALSERLGNIHGWLRGEVGPDRAYAFQGFRVYARPATAADLAVTPRPNVLGWPLATPLASFGTPVQIPPGMRCGVVRGRDLATFLPLARRSTQISVWRSDGRLFRLLLVPLLPDQVACSAGAVTGPA